MSTPEATTRREFARRMALLAAGAPLASCTTAPPAPVPEAPSPPAPEPESEEKPRPVAESLFEIVRHRYGEELSAEQLAEVREDIENYLGWAEAMQKVELENSDGLACGVGMYRGGA